MGVWTWLQKLFEPDDQWPLYDLVGFERQRQIQALWIGILAFILPILLYIGNRNADCFRDSISHSYYLPFWGDVFVAMTCSVGLFLMFYRGQSFPERALAVCGGTFAILVALNPTNGSGCDDMIAQSRIFLLNPAELSDRNTATLLSAYPAPETWTGELHLTAAVLLFGVLAIFNLFVFTATDKNNESQKGGQGKNKIRRNRIYKTCGFLMIITVSALAIGISDLFKTCDAFDFEEGLFAPVQDCPRDFWDRYNFTFYGEWAGLALFGIAWFVKGRGGGFLLLDESDTWFSKSWWWPPRLNSINTPRRD